jgi:formiminotetrahydrofolate cyclodeaminase
MPWNRHDLPKMNEENRSQRRQRLVDAVDRAAKSLSDFDAKETS